MIIFFYETFEFFVILSQTLPLVLDQVLVSIENFFTLKIIHKYLLNLAEILLFINYLESVYKFKN